jgi:hypothetical protein
MPDNIEGPFGAKRQMSYNKLPTVVESLLIIITLITLISIFCTYEIRDYMITVNERLKTVDNFGNGVMQNLRLSIKKKLGKRIICGFKIYPDLPPYIHITIEEIDKIKKMPEKIFSDIQNVGLWSLNRWPKDIQHHYMPFWSVNRQILNRFYSKHLNRGTFANVELPVIHFRCSDIPFNRHRSYHIPKKNMIVWVSSILKEKKMNQAIFLTCNKHLSSSNEKQLCSKFKDIYIELFKNEGITLLPTCNDIRTDLAVMFYSPLLISLNGSSFSFSIGISKPPDQFITSNMGEEVCDKRRGDFCEQPNREPYTALPYALNDQNVFDWKYFHEPPLLHSEIKDYYDLDEVRNKILFN